MSRNTNIPPQLIPFNRKTKAWRKKMMDWASSKSYFNYSPVRNSAKHKKINYDLLNGVMHMSDLDMILNPDNVKASYMPEKILHYPIINSKLNVLLGEESKRIFDYRVIVTNPNAISEIEQSKTAEILEQLKSLVENQELEEDQFNLELEKIDEYYNYDWQDAREIRANALLNHYSKEYNIPLIFNNGFTDALAVGEEMYLCDIRGGEPTFERLNPLKTTIFKSGYSNKIEDADAIILEDYWSPGKIIDTFYEVLTKKDMKYIEELPDKINSGAVDSMDNIDESKNLFNLHMTDETLGGSDLNPLDLFNDNTASTLSPYDASGNIRVLRLFWKSRRRIKKVKSYDPETGEEDYTFYPETYILNEEEGEEEQIFYINEAWEGTKIGEDIYVNMRPRVVQYNRLSNPSRCHFGIVGSVYNVNESKPFSLIDMMKPYNYLYNVIHDRLNKSIAANWGKILEVDLALIPKGWKIDKWLYYAKINSIAVKDSFKEGNIGTSTGKLAGQMANNTKGVIDAETGDHIQHLINLLEFIKMEMSEVAGISRLREGLISNRETVGGVERATLQSSHITEWYFLIHDDVKQRALECFLETAKIALKGRSKKFQYLLSDMSMKVAEIDGDEFSESDYGLAVDNSDSTQNLNSLIEGLAQAALQNQALSFGAIAKLYGSSSIAEKQRMIERDEAKMQERQSQAQQAEQQIQEQLMQMQQEAVDKEIEFRNIELQLKDTANIRDNETKMAIASINAQVNTMSHFEDGVEDVDPLKRDELLEKIRLFNVTNSFNKMKHKDEIKVKEKAINKASQARTNNNK